MSGPDLAAEMRQAGQDLDLHTGKQLAELGVTSWPRLLADGIIGRASAIFDKLDRFEIVPTGDAPSHLIVAVTERGELIDLVAFRLETAGHWATRTGNGAMLGHDAYGAALNARGWSAEQASLILHRSPLDWLRADATGCCVIDDFAPATAARLRKLRQLEVPSAKFARALRLRLLPPPPPIPEMIIAKGSGRWRA